MITPIEQVRAAYARAMELAQCAESATFATAQSLGLPLEAVRDVVEQMEQAA